MFRPKVLLHSDQLDGLTADLTGHPRPSGRRVPLPAPCTAPVTPRTLRVFIPCPQRKGRAPGQRVVFNYWVRWADLADEVDHGPFNFPTGTARSCWPRSSDSRTRGCRPPSSSARTMGTTRCGRSRRPSARERSPSCAGSTWSSSRSRSSSPVVIAFAFGITGNGPRLAVGFLVGVAGSALAGAVGMLVSVRANVRTAAKARGGNLADDDALRLPGRKRHRPVGRRARAPRAGRLLLGVRRERSRHGRAPLRSLPHEPLRAGRRRDLHQGGGCWHRPRREGRGGDSRGRPEKPRGHRGQRGGQRRRLRRAWRPTCSRRTS